jgi:hypothetical protein
MTVTIEDRRTFHSRLNPSSFWNPVALLARQLQIPWESAQAASYSFIVAKSARQEIGNGARGKTTCVTVKKARLCLERAERAIRDPINSNVLRHDHAAAPGDNPFLGRQGFPEDDVLELIAGRFCHDRLTNEYMEALGILIRHVRIRAERHGTRFLWEEVLKIAVEMK